MTELSRFVRRMVQTACLALPLGVLATDASAANREHQQLMADIRMIQEQTQQLQVTLNALTDTLKLVTGRLDDQGNASRKALADQRLLIETLGGDVRVVREKVDETNVRIASLSQEVEAMRGTLTTLATPPPPVTLPSPEEGVAPSPDNPQPTVTPVAPPPAPTTTGLSPQRMYDQAYADYAAGQWSLAILGFEQYIKAFPRSEQADDAQFTIGEAHLFDGKTDQALAAYDKVIANYPPGDQVSMAYYKKGVALERLKQFDKARDAWQTVLQKYPDSNASLLAKQGLDRLARANR